MHLHPCIIHSTLNPTKKSKIRYEREHYPLQSDMFLSLHKAFPGQSKAGFLFFFYILAIANELRGLSQISLSQECQGNPILLLCISPANLSNSPRPLSFPHLSKKKQQQVLPICFLAQGANGMFVR